MTKRSTLKALWVGGPPGKTLDNITRNLLKEGIEITERWDSVVEVMRSKHRIPTEIEVVLLNHEMCSHAMQDKIKTLAKKAQKPFVLASFGSRKTIIELRAKGIITEKIILKNTSQHTPTQNEHDDAIIRMVSGLIDEKAILLVQQKGIKERLKEIEERLQEIRNRLNLDEKKG